LTPARCIVGIDEKTLTPRATTSGFTRPSFAGPRELKSGDCTLAVVAVDTAPNSDDTFFADAVTPIVSNGIRIQLPLMRGCFTGCLAERRRALSAGQSVPLPSRE
jgi:hypothetical protein